MQARFITFEGGEGAGKTTQIQRLVRRLEASGHSVVSTREPGGTAEAEKIRHLLVDRAGGHWHPVAETLLLFAARHQHVTDVIQPALAAGRFVVCDRFTDSTRAYQGAGGGVSQASIEHIRAVALGDFEPDLTFILDVPPEIGLARAKGRMARTAATEDRFERLDLGFHERLRQHFLDIAAHNPARCHVLDATQSADTLENAIWQVVSA